MDGGRRGIKNINYSCSYSIAKIFSPRNMNYTVIPNKYNLELLVKQLVLFDLNHPIIIDIENNLPLFLILQKKFNKRGNCMLKHINLTDKYEVDGIFQIMKDFVYINYNPVHVCSSYTAIRRENVKLFYFKNLMICYSKSESISLVSKILIDHMKLKFVKNPENFFEEGKKKKINIYDKRIIGSLGTIGNTPIPVSLDDNTIYESDQEHQEDAEIFMKSSHSNFNFNEEISNSLNIILHSDSKLNSDTVNLYRNGQEMMSLIKSSNYRINSHSQIKNSRFFPKFNFLNFYLNLFSHAIKSLVLYGDKLITEGELLKDKYLIIEKDQKSQFLKSLLIHQEKIEILLEEIKIKYSFMQNLSLDEGEPSLKSYKSVLKMSFIEETNCTSRFNYKRDFNTFKEKFNFLIKSFLGKLKDMEMNMKKQINTSEMMIKTLKIIQDDDKYMRDRKLNILFVIMTIFQFLLLPVLFTQAWFSVNIKIPMGEVQSLLPYVFLILIMVSMPAGQLYVFYRYKHLIL